MSIETDLKKDGIIVVDKLDTLKVNSIATKVSNKLCEAFPNFNLDKNDLFIRLSRLNMYIANMPEGMAEANYFYKNSSIYFNSHIPLKELDEFAIHECIHYLQEIKDKKNYLTKMGLADYTEFKIYGLALNEAAVQLMSSKIIGINKEYVKYFGINFETTSPSYYPLECCLVSQLAYLVGEDALFESTLYSNDNFKNKLLEIISYKNFTKIENYLDSLLSLEEEIVLLNNKLLLDNNNYKINNINSKICKLKNNISSVFIKAQNLIITSYFDSAFDKITNLEEIENYRKKLYNFKDYLGSTENYTYFNDYYVHKMMDLEKKHNYLELYNNNISELNLVPIKQNMILKLLDMIKKLFTKNINGQVFINDEK